MNELDRSADATTPLDRYLGPASCRHLDRLAAAAAPETAGASELERLRTIAKACIEVDFTHPVVPHIMEAVRRWQEAVRRWQELPNPPESALDASAAQAARECDGDLVARTPAETLAAGEITVSPGIGGAAAAAREVDGMPEPVVNSHDALLEACRQLLPIAHYVNVRYAGNDDTGAISRAIVDARAAIALATGEETP